MTGVWDHPHCRPTENSFSWSSSNLLALYRAVGGAHPAGVRCCNYRAAKRRTRRDTVLRHTDTRYDIEFDRYRVFDVYHRRRSSPGAFFFPNLVDLGRNRTVHGVLLPQWRHSVLLGSNALPLQRPAAFSRHLRNVRRGRGAGWVLWVLSRLLVLFLVIELPHAQLRHRDL